MAAPFQPLLRLVALAVLPIGRSFVTGLGSAGGASSTKPLADRHALAPETLAWDYAPDVNYSPYDPTTRYRVAARDKKGDVWVSLNSPTQALPPPPDRTIGPIGCYCRDVDGLRGTRYGPAQENLALWCPSLYDARRAGAPFIPDLFLGEGPCFAVTQHGDLAQWDPEWVEKYDEGVRIRDAKWNDFCWHDEVDDGARKALRLRVLPSFFPPPHYAADERTLHEDYGTWVAHKQELRGQILERLVRDHYWTQFRVDYPDLWTDLRSVGYFSYPPVGVWVRDTLIRVKEILELQSYGVPVYYRWNEEFADSSRYGHLADLSPRFMYGRADVPPMRNIPRTPPGSPPIRASGESAGSASRGNASSIRAPGSAQVPDNVSVKPVPAAVPDLLDDQYWQDADVHVKQLGVERRATRRNRRAADKTVHWTTPADGGDAPVEPAPNSASWSFTPPSINVRVEGGRADRERVRHKVAAAVADEGVPSEAESRVRIVAEPPQAVPVPVLLRRMSEDPTSLSPPELRLFVTGTESAEELLRGYVRVRGKDADLDSIVQFLVARRMPFRLMVQVPPLAVSETVFAVTVGSHLYVSRDAALSDCFSQWVEGCRVILHTVRAARAAVLYGGLIARIAEYVGLDQPFRRYPSPFVCSSGSPNDHEENGIKYYDDWLSAEELRVFVGATGPDKESPSLLPPVELFDTFYSGSWAATYEEWFCGRIDELRTGSRKGAPAKALCTKREWKLMLKGYPFGKKK